MLDQQRDNIIASIQQLNRVAGTFAGQRDVIDRALKDIPPALDVLIKERPQLTTALEKLGQFSDTATGLVNDAGDDLVTDLKNLEPTLKALADIGPDLSSALIWATAFPYGPGFADTITRGDYINLVAIFDLTYPRLKKTLLLGTRWGDENAKLIPAPGDPYYLNYSYNPMSVGVAPPPGRGVASAAAGRACAAPDPGPVLPVAPPPTVPQTIQTAGGRESQIFAGPFGRGRCHHRPPSLPRHRPTYRLHREVVADADPFRPKPVDYLHDRVDRRRGRHAVHLHAGADAVGYRPHQREAGAACGRRSVQLLRT